MLSILALGLLAVLPFEYFPSIDIAGYTLKVSYLLAIALLVVAGWNWLRKQWKPTSFSVSDWALLVLLITATLSALVNTAPLRVWVLTALWWFMIGTYWVLRSQLTLDQRMRQKVTQVVLWVALVVTVFGVYQFVADALGVPMEFTLLRLHDTKLALGFPRIQSVGIEPMYFSNYLFWPIVIALGAQLQRKRFGWLESGVVLAGVICLVLGISRGAWLAAALAGVVYVYLVVSSKVSARLIWGQLGLVAAGLVISASLLIGLTSFKNASVFVDHALVKESAPTQNASLHGRVTTATEAIEMFKRQPLLGGGVGSFGIQHRLEDGEFSLVTNEYLELLAEVGVIGLLAYVVAMGALLWSWWSKRKALPIATLVLACSLIAHLIQGITISPLYLMWFWGFLALFASLVESTTHTPTVSPDKKVAR